MATDNTCAGVEHPLQFPLAIIDAAKQDRLQSYLPCAILLPSGAMYPLRFHIDAAAATIAGKLTALIIEGAGGQGR
jgi:hypothetical protein